MFETLLITYSTLMNGLRLADSFITISVSRTCICEMAKTSVQCKNGLPIMSNVSFRSSIHLRLPSNWRNILKRWTTAATSSLMCRSSVILFWLNSMSCGYKESFVTSLFMFRASLFEPTRLFWQQAHPISVTIQLSAPWVAFPYLSSKAPRCSSSFLLSATQDTCPFSSRT